MLRTEHLKKLLDKATVILANAEEILVKQGGLAEGELLIEEKGQADFVTNVDRALEAFIKKELSQILPSASFLGEETGFSGPSEDLLWVIDPIDGTTNFTRRLCPYAVSIGLVCEGIPIIGLLSIPSQNWFLRGGKGLGAWNHKKPLHLAPTALGPYSMTGIGLHRTIPPPHWLDILAKSQGRMRLLGSIVTHLGALLTGAFDLIVHQTSHIWDIAGGAALLLEAGGIMAKMDGTNLIPFPGDIINGGAHPFIAGHETTIKNALTLIRSSGKHE